MTPDFVTVMAASKLTRSHAHSALPDAPVIDDFISKPVREPRMLTLRKQLAGMIWPGELVVPTSEQTVPASGC